MRTRTETIAYLESINWRTLDPIDMLEKMTRFITDGRGSWNDPSGNYVLIPRKMTPKERATIALPAAQAALRKKRAEYALPIWAEIDALRKSQPAITWIAIARHLDTTHHKPPRATCWTARGARRLYEGHAANDEPSAS